MPPKAKAKAGVKRKRQDEWWTGKSTMELELCFKKELALALQQGFNEFSTKRVTYFRRNYLQVPHLESRCDGVIEEINDMANHHLREEVSERSEWDAIGETLRDFLLPEPEEHKSFLKITWPKSAFSFGDKSPQKDLPVALAGKVRNALVKWWYTDVRQWAYKADAELSGATLSRVLFAGDADHLEIKVAGLGRSVVCLLPETAQLEALAHLVDERIIMKWQESQGREEEYYGSWVIELVDRERKGQLLKLMEQVLAARCPDADPAKVKDMERLCTSCSDDFRLQNLGLLIKQKQEWGGLTEQEANRYKREMERCLPYKRFDSCNEEMGADAGPQAEYLQNRHVSALPAPEDGSHVSINLSWIKLWDELKVEVVARVPKDMKRPYAIVRYKESTCDPCDPHCDFSP